MNIRKNYKKHALISGFLALVFIGGGIFSGAEKDPLLPIGFIAFFWFAYVMLRYHKCPKCRKSLPLFDFKSTHCRYCGSSLDAPETNWLVCPKCGKSNHRFDANKREIRFCGNCGYPLDRQAK